MADDGGRRNRELLRPWLEGLLNKNSIDEVRWINESKTQFQIPWYHNNKPTWSRERGQIFKAWAMHTGRYREGIDDEDWTRWKTRLRCALTKAPDIEEIKINSQNNGVPYKFYKLLPRNVSGRQPRTEVHAHTEPMLGFCEAPLPTVLREYEEIESLPSDLAGIPDDELMQDVDNEMISGLSDFSINDFPDMANDYFATWNENDHEMLLDLYYCNKKVYSGNTSKQSGCWLHYGRDMGNIPVETQSQVYSDDPDDYWLPPCKGLMGDEYTEREVQKVIERGMPNGVHIRIVNNNILVSRFCMCSIYYASLLGTGGNPIKLTRCKRDVETTMIFDYANCFVPAIERYTMENDSLVPDPWVYLLIGSEKPLSELHESVPVFAKITTQRAWNQYISATEKKKKTVSSSVEDMSCDSLELPLYGITRPLSFSEEDLDAILQLNPVAEDMTCLQPPLTENRLPSSTNLSDIFDSSLFSSEYLDFI